MSSCRRCACPPPPHPTLNIDVPSSVRGVEEFILTSSDLLLMSPLVSHLHLHYNFIDATPGLSLTSSVLLFCCRPWSLILTFTTVLFHWYRPWSQSHFFSSPTAVAPGLSFSPSQLYYFIDTAPGLSLTSSVLLLLSPLVSHSHLHNCIISLMTPLVSVSPLQFSYSAVAPGLSFSPSQLYYFIDAAPGLSLTSSGLLFCCRPWSLNLTFSTISLMPPPWSQSHLFSSPTAVTPGLSFSLSQFF